MKSLAMHVLHSDFDGTMVDIHAASPNGVTLESSCIYAVNRLFGPTGVLIYKDLGGIQHRAPAEMVQLILEYAGDRDLQMENDDMALDLATHEFVDQKLSQLLPEISRDWPKVFPGYREMVSRLPQLGIAHTIISNGHDRFISRVFEVNDIPLPDVMVTSDTLFEEGSPTRYKPDPYGLELATRKIVEAKGGIEPLSMMLIGDSVEKDDTMAQNFGIPFGLFNRDLSYGIAINNSGRKLAFKGYQDLNDFIWLNAQKFRGGEGFNAMFLNGNHPEGYRAGKERR